MKKLYDGECINNDCGEHEKPVEVESEGVAEGKLIDAMCEECGSQLKHVISRVNIGGAGTKKSALVPDIADFDVERGVDDEMGEFADNMLERVMNIEGVRGAELHIGGEGHSVPDESSDFMGALDQMQFGKGPVTAPVRRAIENGEAQIDIRKSRIEKKEGGVSGIIALRKPVTEKKDLS